MPTANVDVYEPPAYLKLNVKAQGLSLYRPSATTLTAVLKKINIPARELTESKMRSQGRGFGRHFLQRRKTHVQTLDSDKNLIRYIRTLRRQWDCAQLTTSDMRMMMEYTQLHS